MKSYQVTAECGLAVHDVLISAHLHVDRALLVAGHVAHGWSCGNRSTGN